MLKLDRISMNWVLLVIPLLVGALANYLPMILPGFGFDKEDAVHLQWGTLCTLVGAVVSLQIGIRRWIVADRLVLEQRLEEMFRSHDRALHLVSYYARLKQGANLKFFGVLADEVVQDAARQLRGMLQDRQFTLKALTPSDEYVRRWGQFMDTLMERGSTFITITNIDIWSREYMGGPRSTYLHKNASSEGRIEIKRVFVVPSDEMVKDYRHRDRLRRVLQRYHDKLKDAREVETKVFRSRTREEYFQHFNPGGDSDNFGIWKLSNDLQVCLLVRYRPASDDRYEITDIIFREDEDFVSQKRPLFDEKFEEAVPLEDYMKWLREEYPDDVSAPSVTPPKTEITTRSGASPVAADARTGERQQKSGLSRDKFSSLEIRGPIWEGDFEIWEAVDRADDRQAYSCIALCRKYWVDGWPALGGTRWVPSSTNSEEGKTETRHQAIELAMSMYNKNSILRHAAHSLQGRKTNLFNWQGGKGVIWTPPDQELDEHRLRCHGRLIDHLKGRYIGAKDAGVANRELKIMNQETPYIVGLQCGRDSGEATAYGVLAGMEQAVLERWEEFSCDPEAPLRGLQILVIGIGKVGLPLIGLLHGGGAEVFAFDDHLKADPEWISTWYSQQVERGAAVGEDHLKALQEIAAAGRLFSQRQEAEALSQREIRIISPNGGPTEWLSRKFGDKSRAQVLGENRRRHGNLRLILGAGNDQVPTTDAGRQDREKTLAVLAEAGLSFVPDPLVSMGGVISVSHERSEGGWDARAVNEDAGLIVRRSVEQVFREARRLGGTDAVTMYRAFLKMIEGEWN